MLHLQETRLSIDSSCGMASSMVVLPNVLGERRGPPRPSQTQWFKASLSTLFTDSSIYFGSKKLFDFPDKTKPYMVRPGAGTVHLSRR